MVQQANASTPAYIPEPPRRVSDEELEAVLRIADALIPDGTAGPRPSLIPDYPLLLSRALAARRDAFDEILALASELSGSSERYLKAKLRELGTAGDASFGDLSAVIAGAYLMASAVRERIGYPGQAQRTPPFDQAASEIESGILDPVIARGPIYRLVDRDSDDLQEARR